ncbi:hypothetical protein ILUMI_10393 [Ignelater luminosus]|uniref:RING-type E3 ubiquitin transferase n=1 Tax=Ignelater luminosus TaxID=2038154 RepID=A0A8K0D2C9_IGNLU|nr:hypothetical protein ILUMI_10393 [Ignelater luminosus]
MSLNISNIENLLNELRCTQCKKLLSVLPIYYCSATGHVCGRCSSSLNWMIANGTLERALAYEAVAKYLVFPCSNMENGCKAELRWLQVEEHERTCNLNAFPCPFNMSLDESTMQCDWKGSMIKLPTHLITNHTSNIQTLPISFVMNIEENNLQIIPVTVNERNFLILTRYLKETNKFYCVVMCCSQEPENQFYRYQLELGRYDDYFLILRKSNTEPFDDTTRVINNNERMIAVDVASVAAMLGNPNFAIHCKVSISKKNKNEISTIMKEHNISLPSEEVKNLSLTSKGAATVNGSPIKNPPKVASLPSTSTPPPLPAKNFPPPLPSKSTQSPQKTKPKAKSNDSSASNSAPDKAKLIKQLSTMDKQLLEELECPICKNHMIPPIYICPTGHSLCSDCKEKIKICAFCQSQIMNTRNYTLEKLTTRVHYPCKYVDIGCQEIFTSENIRHHEMSCTYGTNKCPLKMLPSMCSTRILPLDILQHIRDNHSNNVIEVSQVYSRNIKAKITSSYDVVIHENEIFICCCKHSATSGPIKFNFVHVGMKNNQSKYRYELEFLDQTNKGMMFVISQLCQALPSNISSALKNCLTIPLELLQPFILKKGHPTLFFKFYISKV